MSDINHYSLIEILDALPIGTELSMTHSGWACLAPGHGSGSATGGILKSIISEFGKEKLGAILERKYGKR